MSNAPDNGSHGTLDHIEQIRDIIFGPQKREYDQRLEKLNAEIRLLKEELARLSKETIKGETKVLGEIEARSKVLTESIASLRAEQGDARKTLQAELQAQKETLATNLEEQVTALRAEKVSRDTLAELLQAMALQLKGTTVRQELERAVRKNSAE